MSGDSLKKKLRWLKYGLQPTCGSNVGCNRFLALLVFFHSECKKTVFLHAVVCKKPVFFHTPVFLHACKNSICLTPACKETVYLHSLSEPTFLPTAVFELRVTLALSPVWKRPPGGAAHCSEGWREAYSLGSFYVFIFLAVPSGHATSVLSRWMFLQPFQVVRPSVQGKMHMTQMHINWHLPQIWKVENPCSRS